MACATPSTQGCDNDGARVGTEPHAPSRNRTREGHPTPAHREAVTVAQTSATVIEAYPVVPDSPSYRFMGFVPVFAAAGPREVGRAGIRRHVMRLHVR